MLINSFKYHNVFYPSLLISILKKCLGNNIFIVMGGGNLCYKNKYLLFIYICKFITKTFFDFLRLGDNV